MLQQHRPDAFEAGFGIDHEQGDVHHVGEGGAGRGEDGVEIGEGQADLIFQLRLGRAIGAATDLPGDEEKAVGTDGRRIAVLFVEGVALGGKDDVAGHGGAPGGDGWGHLRRRLPGDKPGPAVSIVCTIQTIPW